VVDFQAPRCAFTLNEAVCPRGKLIYAYNNGGDGTFPTPSRWVKDIEISRPGSVILATEFCTNFSVVTGFDSTTGTPGTCKSHRPVTGFKVDDEKYVELNDFKPNGTSQWRVCTPTDLWDNSNSAYNGGGAGTGGKTADALNNQSIQGSNFAPGIATTAGEDQAAHNGSRLDWVGRNHPGGKTNFLFCDGHVENKTKEETLPTTASVLSGSGGEWGEKPYGLVGY
jgi:prepilin-type processing-associated H-X9-DG protein